MSRDFEQFDGEDMDLKRREDSQPLFARKHKPRPDSNLDFSYRNIDVIRQFITEHGKIVPRRVSRLSAFQQRKLRQSVKIARQLALIPYTVQA